MANIHTVFEAILEIGTSGKKTRVGVADKHEYETVRTRLVKLWNEHKQTLIAIAGEGCDPLLEFSLCGNYDREESAGYFFLGKPRRKLAKEYSFSIVETLPSTEAVNDDTSEQSSNTSATA
jgi:hypothetical protein